MGARSTKCSRKDCENERFDNDHHFCGKHLSEIGVRGCCKRHQCKGCDKFTLNTINLQFETITGRTIFGQVSSYQGIKVVPMCKDCIGIYQLQCQKPDCQEIVNDRVLHEEWKTYDYGAETIIQIESKNPKPSIYCENHECYYENCINEKACPYHSCGIKTCDERPNQTGYCQEHSDR